MNTKLHCHYNSCSATQSSIQQTQHGKSCNVPRTLQTSVCKSCQIHPCIFQQSLWQYCVHLNSTIFCEQFCTSTCDSQYFSVVQVGNELTFLVDLSPIYQFAYLLPSVSPLVTSLGYDNQSRTLTCMFDRGPATTVTWRKDGAVITPNATYQQTTRVVDLVTGTYQTVLTIDSSVRQSDIVGLYNCSMENNRGRSSAMAAVGELILKEQVCMLLLHSLYESTSMIRAVTGSGELILHKHIQYDIISVTTIS